ncbi:MAG TPA: hydrogenase maturation protease [Burkholderiaceae bacterium]|nr:hydrogenase maturation protease [Burkholderiaceae bacterium]HMX10993.1 hydrogenase maturation protease [Burkholderiaceae bacterium]HNB43555.1 hydrogenase maturation protease [Burkholderiaceae bacterium]HNG79461.1 hydrogenase maturation protease [Burkholderiaceae bacterium]
MAALHIDATNDGSPVALSPLVPHQTAGAGSPPARALVLGLGNRLLGDDAAGPLVVEALAERHTPPGITACWRDGGTLGLSLLPEIEAADALLVVDAARFGAEPGTVRVFEGAAMDAQLGGRKRSAHELALADLLGAAALVDRLPPRRALVAVEPGSTAVGLALSAVVASAFAPLCEAVQRTLADWAGARPAPESAAEPRNQDWRPCSREECVDEIR